MPQMKVFDDEGNEISEVTPELLASILPNEAVKTHPAFKEILSESIERRQTIKTLKEQLEAKQPVVAPSEPTPAPSIDVEKIYAEVRERLAKEAAAERSQRLLIEKIIKDENVDPDLYDVVARGKDEADMRSIAKTLATKGLRFDPTPTGGNGVPAPLAWDRLDERLFGKGNR